MTFTVPSDVDNQPRREDDATTTLPRANGTAVTTTIIVPTRNERASVGLLIERFSGLFRNTATEILFVDDSDDDTPEQIESAADRCGIPVRMIHRPPSERTGGLSGAVIAGMRAARGTWAVVMDADLQHPPELAPRMVAVGESRQIDLVAATRHEASGNASGLGGGYRRAVSGSATRVTKAMFPRRLARLSDPMSGFFAVRLSAINLDALRPVGFKILLEIAVRNPRLQIAEVPFVFGVRMADASKASPREGMRFIRHITRLRFGVLKHQVAKSSTTDRATRLRRFLGFGLVGASGVAVNEAALWLVATELLRHHHYLWAAIFATEASTSWNFVLTEWLVFRGPKPGTRLGRGVRFYLVNHLALLLRLPLLAFLVEVTGLNVLVANLVTLLLLFVVRFVIADAAIYAQPEPSADEKQLTAKQPMRIVVDLSRDRMIGTPVAGATVEAYLPLKPARPGSSYLPYRYSIDGLLTIGSQVPLRELEYFRAQWLGNDVDLSIRIDHVGRNAPRLRALMTQSAGPSSFMYQEHLGRLGANFRVEIGDTVHVTCSPVLARSPHVLYTNVIEALLRFLAVSRGRILLHSACLQLHGHGLLLSARTDTGKTGTVLRLLREQRALFLSDDMTLIAPDGTATCFPKPLTISHHTLRAVNAGDLTHAEWRRLKLQSRLHSKEGRNFGMVLAGLNIPIMGVNAMTQRVVPPPKYTVDRLVECNTIRHTTIEELFVIERAAPGLAAMDFDETVETLVANTDDAYGFPPFRQMAPSIVIGEDDYAALRAKELEILKVIVGKIRARRLATDDFSWADRIAELMPPAPGEIADESRPERAMSFHTPDLQLG